MRWPDGRAKAFTTSYDDGFQQDAALICLMDRYGIRGTFNLNGGFLRREGLCSTEIYKTGGQEIALHGLHHDPMPALADANGWYEVLREREILEEEYGTVVQGMAYPNGRYSPGTMERLAACGVLYSRTVQKLIWLRQSRRALCADGGFGAKTVCSFNKRSVCGYIQFNCLPGGSSTAFWQSRFYGRN